MKVRHVLCVVSCFLGLGLSLAARAEEPKLSDSLMGIKLGMSKEAAKKVLDKLGKGAFKKSHEGGWNGAWMLTSGPYKSVAFEADKEGYIEWVTLFAKPGNEVRFEDVFDMSKATTKSDRRAIWLGKTEKRDFTLIAKGGSGKASVVSLRTIEERGEDGA